MTLRDELHQLLDVAMEVYKDPLKHAMSPSDIVLYGTLKTDIYMANQALLKNSVPMIQHYIDKLKLQVEVTNGKKESKNNG